MPEKKTLLCLPQVSSPVAKTDLDKFHGVAVVSGKWTHPYSGKTINITEDMLESMASNWNKYRKHIMICTPEGHTSDPAKNKGFVDQESEAKVVDVEYAGKKLKGLDFVYDLKDSEYIKAAESGSLRGRSVSIDDDYRISLPDGKVLELGFFPNHVAWTQEPVQSQLPALEPVTELSRDGKTQFEYVQLAYDEFMDPPDAVVNGERLATHDECDYRAGSAGASCSSCLAYVWDASCEFVEGPIKQAGLCNFFRHRYNDMSVVEREKLVESGLAMSIAESSRVQMARNPKKPYGDVTYADPGYQEDGVHRYPVDSEKHIRAALNYVSKDKNAAKYTAGQLRQIKARIVEAWKKKIDKDGPPSADMGRDFEAEFPMSTAEEVVASFARLGAEKNSSDAFSTSGKLFGDLDSRLNEAGKSLVGSSWPNKDGVNAMDLKQLSKQFGVTETEDATVFVDSIRAKASSEAVVKFAKSLGVDCDGSDVAKAAEQIKTQLGKDAADKAKVELASELAERDKRIAELERSSADMAKERKLDQVESKLSKMANRISAAQSSGRMAKADDEILRCLGKDGDKPILFNLQFDRSAKYEDEWSAQYAKVDARLEMIEARAENSAVPKETTATVLSKSTFSGDHPNPGQTTDNKDEVTKQREEAKAASAKYKRKQSSAA